jgi:hypothetical protein
MECFSRCLSIIEIHPGDVVNSTMRVCVCVCVSICVNYCVLYDVYSAESAYTYCMHMYLLSRPSQILQTCHDLWHLHTS